MKIITERLVLRKYQNLDLFLHHEVISNPKTMYHIQDIMSHSIEKTRENIRHSISELELSSDERKDLFLVISLKDNEKYMGGIGYSLIEDSPIGKLVEVGYFLNPKHWGHGYAREAMKAMIKYAITYDNVFRINATCISDNIRSARALVDSGFTYEGRRRRVQYHHGNFVDRDYYGFVKGDDLKKIDILVK